MTDIILGFVSEREIPCDHRDEPQQRNHLGAVRGAELAQRGAPGRGEEVEQPLLRRAVSGDDAVLGERARRVGGRCRVFCFPGSGKGRLVGAAALAAAFQKHPGVSNSEEYDASFHPFIEEVQAEAERFGLEGLCREPKKPFERETASRSTRSRTERRALENFELLRLRSGRGAAQARRTGRQGPSRSPGALAGRVTAF